MTINTQLIEYDYDSWGEKSGLSKKYQVSLAGWDEINPDGSIRQKLLAQCGPDEELKLVRKMNNPEDRYAVGVYNKNDQELGTIGDSSIKLAYHLDMGGQASAKIIKLTLPKTFLGISLGSKKNFECVLELSKIETKRVPNEYMEHLAKTQEIEMLLNSAILFEGHKPKKAIATYKQVITKIKAYDAMRPEGGLWRGIRYPIEKLSMLLEQIEDYQDAYNEILIFEDYMDILGLVEEDEKKVLDRKKRLEKRFGTSVETDKAGEEIS